MDQQEVEQLAPATARLREERERVEAQNRELAALIRRKEALLERLRSLLAEMETERRGIQDEQTRILAATAGRGPGLGG